MTILQLFLWVQFSVTPPSPIEINRAMTQAQQGPTLLQFQQAALSKAKPEIRASKQWMSRARASAALPSVSVQFDRRNDQGWDLNESAGAFKNSSTDRGFAQVLRIRAVWDLSLLVFNPYELRVTRAQLDLVDWQKNLLVEVTQLYFERLRLVVSLRLADSHEPNANPNHRMETQLRILEIQGILTALTGQAWS